MEDDNLVNPFDDKSNVCKAFKVDRPSHLVMEFELKLSTSSAVKVSNPLIFSILFWLKSNSRKFVHSSNDSMYCGEMLVRVTKLYYFKS